MGYESLENSGLVERLRILVQGEKQTTAEILDCIYEVHRRRLFLELGYTSLFGYLTSGLGYTPAAAQRRIDSARLMDELPELKEAVSSGALNLTQLSMLAQGLRQSEREVAVEEKRNLLTAIQGENLDSTQLILAKALDLKIKDVERRRIQQDESVRMELTFRKEQMAILTRARELVSHTHPNPLWAELIAITAEYFCGCKDPERPRRGRTSAPEAAPDHRVVPAKMRRDVFLRDRVCQWMTPSGHICGSRFQLEVDHIQSVWRGGRTVPENLQLLCSVHNKFKYQQEIGVTPLRPNGMKKCESNSNSANRSTQGRDT